MDVAIMGFGVVGSGVAEVISRGPVSNRINLKYILDIRDFQDSPWKDHFITDFSIIEKDEDVKVAVETIGGVKAAYDFTKRCLMAGKSVVTSNKELVAQHGAQLLELAAQMGVHYLFEASVGGGIPIIRPMRQCLSANRITEVTGILNGTTNYILTHMENNEYEQALAQAKMNGYAESDPTDDINGNDTARKICILASLAFGRHVYPQYVTVHGIEKITRRHIEWAKEAGYVIKLLGRAGLRDMGRVGIITAPYLVGPESQLYSVTDVFNAIVVTGDALGEVMFYGRGAGKLPTASAVVADILDCKNKPEPVWKDTKGDITAQFEPGNFYVFPDGMKIRMLTPI